MQWLVFPLGDLIKWTFGILESFENLPNVMFIIVGFIGFGYWMMLQNKYNKEAENNPNQLK